MGDGAVYGELIGFRRHLRPEIVQGEAVYLFSENGVTALQGKHVEMLAKLLDGTRDLPALLRELPEDVPADQVRRILERLGAAGLVGTRNRADVSPASGAGDAAALAYWDAAGLDAAQAVNNTTSARVRLIAVGDTPVTAMADALRRAELDVNDDDADFSVVLCHDYLAPELSTIDKLHRETGTPWLLSRPTGAQVWVGPVFTPGDGACWHCLAARLSANRTAEAHVQAVRGRAGPATRPRVCLPSVTATALEITALEATKWLAGYRHAGQREIWVYDSLDLRTSHHAVRPRPQCPECGNEDLVSARANRPVRIEPRPKRTTDGGGHRSASPREVLDTYRHLISPITGVIKDLRQDTRGHEFFNSYRSGTNAAAGSGLSGLRSTLRCETGGKGMTPLQAEVGALCEAVERYSGTYHGDEFIERGRYRALADEAVHPDSFQLFHPKQFVDRSEWNAAHAAFQHVPTPFDEDSLLDWTPVWSMTNRCHKLLPTGSLYYGAPAPASVTAHSNGCAAGASLEDAILQGLFELIERDAVALWWYNRTPLPAVDLASAHDPYVDELVGVYSDLGREVWALDLTADLDIPVYAAVSRKTTGQREDIMFGFGAHLDPRIALRRALTELNQIMPPVLSITARQWSTMDIDLRRWLLNATVENQPYLVPDGTRPLDAHTVTPTGDLSTDIRDVQTRLEALGMELLVLDQTRPDVGLPVVRVVVPGLRHFWSRLGPGRLYDVPVRLGRLNRPTDFVDMNPIPLFL
jgi:oxazoline/thiazoline synthase